MARRACESCPFVGSRSLKVGAVIDQLQREHGRPGGVHPCHNTYQSLETDPPPKWQCAGHVWYRNLIGVTGAGPFFLEFHDPDERQGEQCPLS